MLGVRIEPELEKYLNQWVKRTGQSKSECVRIALRYYLINHTEEAKRQLKIAAEHDRKHFDFDFWESDDLTESKK